MNLFISLLEYPMCLLTIMLPTVVSFFITLNFFSYLDSFFSLFKEPQPAKIVNTKFFFNKFKNSLFLRLRAFFFYFSKFSVRQLFWYLLLNFKTFFSQLVSFYYSSAFIFYLKSFLTTVANKFLYWKPLFKRSSYFGYYRSTRTR
jgi:hypothetical protein